MELPSTYPRRRSASPFTLFLCPLIIAGSLGASPVISEFMASNDATLVDEDGDFSDWIEIHNNGASALNLSGYALSDDPDELQKWLFPAVTLSPDGYLIVFASSKNRTPASGQLHTNFSINASGDYLAITAPGGTPIQEFAPVFPHQEADISYGLSADASALHYFTVPTPGSANGNGFAAFSGTVKFSAKRGFYNEPVFLTLSTDTPGERILYTTNGSLPSILRARYYEAPIRIDKTTTIRAVASSAGNIPGKVSTHSYVFPEDVKNQPTMSRAVVDDPAYSSIVANRLTSLPSLFVSLADESFTGPDGIYTNFNDRGLEAEVPISMEFSDPANNEEFEINAGLRIHGGQARTHEKKPMRLYFRSEYGASRLDFPLFKSSPVRSFDNLVLRSGGHDSWATDWGGGTNELTETASYMRDEFTRRSEQAMGVTAPHGRFVQLFINGKYWGMYNLHERADEDYFADHFGGSANDWDVVTSLGEITAGDGSDWADMQALATAGISNPVDYAELQEYLDMDEFIDSLINRMWSGDHDWLSDFYLFILNANGTFRTINLSGTTVNNRNWYAGRRSRGGRDEKFHFFSWDAEISMGNDRFESLGTNQPRNRETERTPIPNRDPRYDLTYINAPNSAGAIYDGLKEYEEFQLAFADRAYQHLFNGGVLTPAMTLPRLNDLADTIREPLVAESARWGNVHGGDPLTRDIEWESEYAWLRDTFLTQRNNFVALQFFNQGLLPPNSPPNFNQPSGNYPAPINLTLDIGTQAGTIFYTADGSDPRQASTLTLTYLVDENATVRALIPTSENGGNLLGDTWKGIADPAGLSSWKTGTTGVGYEATGTDYAPLIGLDVSEMRGARTSVFIRIPFAVDSQATIDAIDNLQLKMRYDDGFVAYLNGVEIASRQAPATLSFDSSATGDHPDSAAIVYEGIDVSANIAALTVGQNILAIHGLNSSVASSDFLIIPRLQAATAPSTSGPSPTAQTYNGTPINIAANTVIKTRLLDDSNDWSPLNQATYFIGDPPATSENLVVSELHYRPSGPTATETIGTSRSDYEFIEIKNISDQTISLANVAFTDGITFTFSGSLAPGAHLLVVANQAAFIERYGNALQPLIAGEFANSTNLSNSGERILLVGTNGATIKDFTFDDDDPWPAAADGDGPTLELIAPDANPDHNAPASWRASLLPNGTPGSSAGDADTDNDNLPDEWEIAYFNDLDEIAAGDPDNDLLDNAAELAAGTNPNDNDSDNDGLKDGEEINIHATNPLNPDSDGDTFTDGFEVLTLLTDPNSTDTDKDGIDDKTERFSDLDPTLADSDGDGFDDGLETRRGSDPTLPNSVPSALPSDLVLYSTMDDADRIGQTVLNLAGPQDGALTGGTSQPGQIGQAINFPTADQLEYQEIGDPGTGCLTIAFWMRANSTTGTQTILSKSDTGEGWGISQTDAALTFSVLPSGGTTVFSKARDNALTAGQWYHITCVIDCGVGKMRTYLNGSDIGWILSIDGDPPRGSLIDSYSPLNVASGFNGSIDDLALWNFPLSEAEISRIYQGGLAGVNTLTAIDSIGDIDFDGLPDSWEITHFGNLNSTGAGNNDTDSLTNAQEFAIGTDPNKSDTDGDQTNDDVEVAAGSDPKTSDTNGAGSGLFADLLLYTPLENSSATALTTGGIVFDQSSPTENGKILAPFQQIPGALGSAFSSSGSAIDFDDVHDPGSDSYTVSIWVRPEGLDQESTQIIAGKGIPGQSGWHLAILGDRFGAFGKDWIAVNETPQQGTTPQPGVWSHLLLELNQTTRLARLFINGSEAGYGLDSRNLPGTIQAPDRHLLIGRNSINRSISNDFIGGIDELAIWSRSLTNFEKLAIENAGSANIALATLADRGGNPSLTVSPASVNLVLNEGEQFNLPVTLTNAGPGDLNWLLEVELGGQRTLEEVRSDLQTTSSAITDLIPDFYAFTDGSLGNFIADGGQDMYDNGNILNTDLATAFPYSNTVIANGGNGLGDGGRYFTRKFTGLFVFAADMNGVSHFEITGDLGADSIGNVSATVLESVRGSRVFRGFVKRVTDGIDINDDSTDPSVNHLIIVEDDTRSATHTFSTDTNNDQHRVSGLTNTTRIYYLMYAAQNGRLIDDADTQQIMDTFLDGIGITPGWLGIESRGGRVDAGGNFDINLALNANGYAPGANQQAILRIFSNDPQAAAVEVPVTLTINTAPTSTPFTDLVIAEDSPATSLSVFTNFADAEDTATGLTYTIDSSATAALLVTPTLTNGQLSIQPKLNQSGEAIIRITATDTNGLSAESTLRVVVTPQPDQPTSTAIANITADDAASFISLNLASNFSDVDPGDTLTYSITGNTNPTIFSALTVGEATGLLNISFAPFVSGSSDVTVTATDQDNLSTSQTFTITLPEIPTPEIAVSQEITLNRQTGLFEQRITVTNLSPRDIGALRVTLSGLPTGIIVHNASGTTIDGNALLTYNRTLAAGASVTLIVEYFSPARRSTLAPQVSVDVSLRQQLTPNNGPTFAIDRILRLPDASVLVEFTSEPNQRYIIQYSDDMATWTDISIPIRAGGTKVQWLDRGPPNTGTHPSQSLSRAYRVAAVSG
jgi:hypothetical protein